MPRAPKKCGRDACETRVVARPYCPQHTPVGWGKKTNPRTGTSEHRTWRAAVLKRDRGVCQIKGPQCTHRATEADHIVPVAEGGPQFDPANGQGACPACHKAKTQAEARRGRDRSR